MSYDTLTVARDAIGIVRVVLNRPGKRNAMDAVMIAELSDMARTVGRDPETRAIILSGAGDVFCAGGDLGWMKAQIDADLETRMAEARKLAEMLNLLNQMPAPLIGQIHGGCFGGGVGLACVCDVVVAGEDARFGLTETRLGLIPATISPYVLARMGEGNARRVFMSARLFSPHEAQHLGIVARVVSEGELEQAATEEATPYLKVAPGAVGAAKSLARFLGPPITDEIIDETVRRLADTWETAEAKAGIEAFLSKTPAPWSR